MSKCLCHKVAPNELRIDAAGGERVKTVAVCAAASVRVELSRTPETQEPHLGN